MNRYQVIVLGILLLCSPGQIVSAETLSPTYPDEHIEISLERTMCFGSCPVYMVTLYGNGTISWSGEMYVNTVGNVTDSIDPKIIQELYDQFNQEGLFELNDTYTAYSITDMPSAILTVRNATTMKQIYHYYGDQSAPETLAFMEDAVDTIANTSRWIGEESLNMEGQETPI